MKRLHSVFTIIALFCFAIALMLHSASPASTLSPAAAADHTEAKPRYDSTATSSPYCSDCYPVVHVVDGDTLDVDIKGVKSRIRIIGIDTPETVKPNTAVQCFGEEASHRASELLSGQFVSLQYDPVAGEKDKYGRLLRYVTIASTTPYDYGLAMIEQGYAKEYDYKKQKYLHREEYQAAQTAAIDAQRGLWGACKK